MEKFVVCLHGNFLALCVDFLKFSCFRSFLCGFLIVRLFFDPITVVFDRARADHLFFFFFLNVFV